MTDSIREAQWLRFYYQSEDAVKDKDLLKDKAWIRTTNKVNNLFMVPFVLQLSQLYYVNVESKTALYKNIRFFKAVTLLGAGVLATKEFLQVKKQWEYYDRFYPEPTELQKALTRESMIFKERQYQVSTVEDKLKKLDDPLVRQMYSQMYQLSPQMYHEPDTNPNAPTHRKHDSAV